MMFTGEQRDYDVEFEFVGKIDDSEDVTVRSIRAD